MKIKGKLRSAARIAQLLDDPPVYETEKLCSHLQQACPRRVVYAYIPYSNVIVIIESYILLLFHLLISSIRATPHF